MGWRWNMVFFKLDKRDSKGQIRWSCGLYATKHIRDKVGEYFKKIDPNISFGFEEVNDRGNGNIKFTALNSLRVGNILYNNENIRLQRKKNVFLNMILEQSKKNALPGNGYKRPEDLLKIVAIHLPKLSSESQFFNPSSES